MANNEYAHYDVVIGLLGAEEVAEKLKQLEEKLKKIEQEFQSLKKANTTVTVGVNDRATAVVRNIYNRLSSVASKVWEGTLTVRDKVSNVIEGIKGKLSHLFGILTSPLGFIGVSVAGAGFGGFVKESLDIAGNLEQTQISFETMLKSGAKAEKLFGDLEKLSIKTPFQLSDILEASKLLLAFGFNADKVIETLRILGDASAGLGLGGEGLKRFAYALGDIKAKGKLEAMDLRQLLTAGVPAYRYLSEGLKLSQRQIEELMSRGLIPSNLGIHMILQGMQKDFAGLTEKQSKSLLGMISNLKDFFELRIMAGFGEGIKEGMPLLGQLTDMLTNNSAKGKEVQNTFFELGIIVGQAINNALAMVMKLSQWLSSPQIKTKSWEEKISLILEKIVNKISEWIKGPGGKAVLELFTVLGKLAIQGLIAGIGLTFKEAIKGNILGSLISGGIVASIGAKLGLGTLLMSLFKGLGKGGKFILEQGAKQEGVIEKIRGASGNLAKVGETAKVLGKAGKIAGAIGLGIQGAFDVAEIIKSKNKPQKAVEKAGAWAGGLVGAKTGGVLGASVGTMIAPGIGTAIGGVIGSVGGWIGGYKGGEWIGKKTGELVLPKITQKENVTKRARGGIISSPEIALIGEAGTEIVIPITKQERGKQLWIEAGKRLGILRGKSDNKNYSTKIEQIAQKLPETTSVSYITDTSQQTKKLENTVKVSQSTIKNINSALKETISYSKAKDVIKETSDNFREIIRQSNVTRVFSDIVNKIKEINYQSYINKVLESIIEDRRLERLKEEQGLREKIEKNNIKQEKVLPQDNGRLFLYSPQVEGNKDIYSEMEKFRPVAYRRPEEEKGVNVKIDGINVNVSQTMDKEELIEEVSRQFTFAFRRALENAV